MADQPSGDLRWLLEPPAPGKVHLHIAVGEGVELSPEVQRAIEGLARALVEPEVAGHALRGCEIVCSPFSSTPNCAKQLDICTGTYSCKITKLFGIAR
jgi:hypothetical protein